MRSEVDILATLARHILPEGRFDWQTLSSHKALRQAISQVVPGLENMATIDDTRREFEIKGRVFHTPQFATPDGKAAFHVTPIPTFPTDAETFTLMTLRSEGQFNTVVYEEEDLYRGNRRRDVVMLSPADAARLGIREGDKVSVATETGESTVFASITDIAQGSLAMYYPEANVLVPRKLDRDSKTPAFKSIAAKLAKV
jgi:anaerobic selenocysteine-containing dehydrogenase